MQTFFNWLDRNRDIGIFILRLFIGLRLIYGVIDNVFSWGHMLKFKEFLQAFQFPYPLISAMVSAYAQLLAGILFIVGFKMRWAALLMIFNFLVAIVIVHRHDTVEQMTPALAMLFCSVLFLFYAEGRYSVQSVLDRKP